MDGINSVSTSTPQQNWTALQSPATEEDSTHAAEQVDTLRMLSEQEEENETLIEKMREAQEKIDAHRKSLQKFYRNTRNTNYGDAPIEACSRLARAKTATQVNSASSYARRRIAQLRQALRQDSDNAAAIRGAIRQLEKAIRRGEKKKRELAQEKATEIRAVKKKQEDNATAARRLCQELKRRKAQRMIRESGYVREAEIDKRLNSQLVQTQMELREQMQSLSSAMTASMEAAAQQYAAAAEAPAPAPEISVEA